MIVAHGRDILLKHLSTLSYFLFLLKIIHNTNFYKVFELYNFCLQNFIEQKSNNIPPDDLNWFYIKESPKYKISFSC